MTWDVLIRRRLAGGVILQTNSLQCRPRPVIEHGLFHPARCLFEKAGVRLGIGDIFPVLKG